MESIVFSIQHLIFALVSTYYVTNFAIAGFFANRIDRYFAMCMLLPTFIFHCSKVKTAASVRSAADRSIAEMVVHDSVLNDDLFGPQSTTEVWPHYFLSLLLCKKSFTCLIGFQLSQRSSRSPTLPLAFCLELKRYKDTVRCATLSMEVPRH